MSWVQSTLGEVADIFSGYAFKSADMNSEGGTPLIKIKNIADSAVSHECDAFLNKDFNLAKFERFHLLRDDFLVAMTGQGSVGRIGKMRDYKPGFYVNQRVAIVRVNPEKANPVFIFYQIATRSNELELFKKANGAGQPNISAKQIGELPVVLPSTEQQQYIADVLSSYDDLIENSQKQIKLLEEAAQRLYKEWFVDLRFPGHETTPIVDGVPEGWRETCMDDICDSIGGGTPSTKSEEYYRDGQIKWVTPTDITRKSGLILLDTEKKITEEGLHNSSAKMVPPYTILMTSRASVGFFGLCEYEVCTNQGFISCIPHEESIRFYLLYNLMNRVDEIRAKASGSTFLEISKKSFRGLKIIVPEAHILTQFNNIVRPMIRQMEILTKTIAKLREARDRLLPKLMSGEIEV